MIDCTGPAGIPLKLDRGANKLSFGKDLIIELKKARKIGEMKDLLLDKPELSDDTEIYFMYDDIYLNRDKDFLKDHPLRYDLTLIPAAKLGREYVKSAGHYHSISRDKLFSYPEIYEVLYGVVHFILQEKGKNKREIEDLVSIQGERGERILVPPNYGHVAINPSSKPLLLANLVAKECKNYYGDIEEYKGAAVFEIEEDGETRIVRNQNYSHIPSLRKVDPDPSTPLIFSNIESLYQLLLNQPDLLTSFWKPSKAIDDFENYIGNPITQASV